MLASDLHRHDQRTPRLQGVQCCPCGGGSPSKWIHTIPTVTSLDSTRVTQLFLEHIWHHHRLPEEVISDHGPAFISNFSHDLATLLGVKLTLSTSYHPQTNSQMECVNQEIEVYLRVFVSH